MQYRELGRTGWKISEISFGAWAIGGDVWGKTDDAESMRALHSAIDAGVNFIDTADVYGDGHSERLVGRLRKERSEEIIVATKAGRRLSPHVADGYTHGTSKRSSIAVSATSAPTRSICSSSTVRRPWCTSGRRCSARSTASSKQERFATTA